MKRQVSSLTYVLSAALIVAVAMLCFVIYRDFFRRDEVELSERTRAAQGTRTRERRFTLPDVGLLEGDARNAPVGEAPTTTSTGTAPALVEGDSAMVAEHQRPSGAAAAAAPAPSGGQGASQWYSGDLTPVIAQFLQKFAISSQWPEETPVSRPDFAIGVLRDDALRIGLTQMLQGKKVDGRPIVVLGREDAAALVSCPIVFVGDLTRADHDRQKLTELAIMTVTYTGAQRDDTWCDIELIWSDRQVEFVVDRTALARKHITAGDALLKSEHAWVRNEKGQAIRGWRHVEPDSPQPLMAGSRLP